MGLGYDKQQSPADNVPEKEQKVRCFFKGFLPEKLNQSSNHIDVDWVHKSSLSAFTFCLHILIMKHFPLKSSQLHMEASSSTACAVQVMRGSQVLCVHMHWCILSSFQYRIHLPAATPSWCCIDKYADSLRHTVECLCIGVCRRVYFCLCCSIYGFSILLRNGFQMHCPVF